MTNAPERQCAGSQAPPESAAPARKKRMPAWLALLIKIAALALLLFLTLTFVMGVHIHEGNRMYPFLMDGDLLITYKLEDYRVGAVVAYRHPDTGKTFYPTAPLEGENVEYPYYMRRGGYFVLDDYRTEGDDSRHFGQLLREDLLGKVVYVFRRRGI